MKYCAPLILIGIILIALYFFFKEWLLKGAGFDD